MNKTGKKLKGSYTVEALIVIPVILTITLTVCGVLRYIEKVNRVITACNAGTVEFNNYITVLNAAGLENIMQNAPQGERTSCDEDINEICFLADISGINNSIPEEYHRGGTNLIVTNNLKKDSEQVKSRLHRISELMKGFTKADVTALITRAYQKSYEHAAKNFVTADVNVKIASDLFTYGGKTKQLLISAKINVPIIWGLGSEKRVVMDMVEMGLL